MQTSSNTINNSRRNYMGKMNPGFAKFLAKKKGASKEEPKKGAKVAMVKGKAKKAC